MKKILILAVLTLAAIIVVPVLGIELSPTQKDENTKLWDQDTPALKQNISNLAGATTRTQEQIDNAVSEADRIINAIKGYLPYASADQSTILNQRIADIESVRDNQAKQLVATSTIQPGNGNEAEHQEEVIAADPNSDITIRVGENAALEGGNPFATLTNGKKVTLIVGGNLAWGDETSAGSAVKQDSSALAGAVNPVDPANGLVANPISSDSDKQLLVINNTEPLPEQTSSDEQPGHGGYDVYLEQLYPGTEVVGN